MGVIPNVFSVGLLTLHSSVRSFLSVKMFFFSLTISWFHLNGVIEFAFKLFAFFFYFGITMTLVFNAFVKQEMLRLIRSKSIW